jgi:hypothetical protein
MKKLKYISLVLALLISTSCEQSLEELNIDPNNPQQATPSLVFPAGAMSSASVIGGRYAIIGGIWSQYYTQNNASNQYKSIEAFYYVPNDFANQWQELYSGSLNDLKYVKKVSAAEENWSFYLMATVIEAYTFQVLTDMHGDIPFSEALKGNEGIANPNYESSQAIYDSLIARLDNALSKDFTLGTVQDPGTSDLIFGGASTPLATDIRLWKQFANTLKLKIYLRQFKAREAVASAGIQALYNSGAEFLTTSAAIDRFADEASKSNPLFEQDQRQLNTTENLKASNTLFKFLQENNDPRVDTLYRENKDGIRKAMNQGDFNAPSTVLDPLTISRAYLNAEDPVYFISKAESYFLQAEAVERGWGTGDAKSLYEEGVKAAFEFFGDPSIAQGLLADEYAYGAHYDNTKLGTIAIQKWASMAWTRQGLEAYFERLRTGYPLYSPVYSDDEDYVAGYIVYPKEGTTTDNKFAKRLFYPDTEVLRNPNAPAQPNIWDPLWWHLPGVQ